MRPSVSSPRIAKEPFRVQNNPSEPRDTAEASEWNQFCSVRFSGTLVAKSLPERLLFRFNLWARSLFGSSIEPPRSFRLERRYQMAWFDSGYVPNSSVSACRAISARVSGSVARESTSDIDLIRGFSMTESVMVVQIPPSNAPPETGPGRGHQIRSGSKANSRFCSLCSSSNRRTRRSTSLDDLRAWPRCRFDGVSTLAVFNTLLPTTTFVSWSDRRRNS